MPDPTRYAPRPDGSLVAYRTAGEGPIDLVFSVGISNCEVLWDHPTSARFLDRIASFSRLIVFDFRGSGMSDWPMGPGLPTWEDWSDDLAAVLDEVGSKQAALFVQALAVPSAIIFAATHPQRTSALILYLPSGMNQSEEEATAIRDVIEHGWGTDAFSAALAPSKAHDKGYISWVSRTQRLSATPRLAAALLYHLQTFDPSGLLPLVRVPALVLSSPAGYMVDRQAHEFAEHISGARLVELREADTLLFGTAGSEEAADHVEEFVTGVPPRPVPNRVLATVLFTDIVSSTEWAEELGDRRWREILATHDQTARSVVEDWGGKLVKTTGDGVLARFEGPGRAVACTQQLARSLQERGVGIRCGLHAGEIELREDGDIGGIAVHIAARVMAAAQRDEILCSRTVKDLTAGSDIDYEDRGVHSLKGIDEPWHLYAVR